MHMERVLRAFFKTAVAKGRGETEVCSQANVYFISQQQVLLVRVENSNSSGNRRWLEQKIIQYLRTCPAERYMV